MVPKLSIYLNYQRMKTNRMPKTLRDVGGFETRMTRLQTGVRATLSNCMEGDVFKEMVRELDERVSQLELKHDAEMKALTARCEGLERVLVAMKETPKQGEMKGKETVQNEEQDGKETVPRAHPPQDPAISRAFSGKDLDVMAKGVNALKKWTGKVSATIVYGSKTDPFTLDGLFEKVRGKRNIALIGFTTEGDVFGGFYSVAVTKQDEDFNDQNIFIFSFESHGRCATPQQFAVKEESKEKAYVRFFKNSYGFVWFGVFCVGGFFLGNERSDSYCGCLSKAFKGLEDTTLTGKNGTWREGPYHHCARLVAFQLE